MAASEAGSQGAAASPLQPQPGAAPTELRRHPRDLGGICHCSFLATCLTGRCTLLMAEVGKQLSQAGSQNRWEFPGRTIKIT